MPLFPDDPFRPTRGYRTFRDAVEDFKRRHVDRLATHRAPAPQISTAINPSYSSTHYSLPGGDIRLPDGSTVSDNLVQTQNDMAVGNELAKALGPAAGFGGTLGQWLGRVLPYGPWDYKHQPGGDDFQGNYNYGATGAALFPEEALLRAGGAAQMLFGLGRYKRKNGLPWGKWPYGDDPIDSTNISAGYAYGKSRLNPK